MLVTMATPISSQVKDKNNIFTARDYISERFISIYIINPFHLQLSSCGINYRYTLEILIILMCLKKLFKSSI